MHFGERFNCGIPVIVWIRHDNLPTVINLYTPFLLKRKLCAPAPLSVTGVYVPPRHIIRGNITGDGIPGGISAVVGFRSGDGIVIQSGQGKNPSACAGIHIFRQSRFKTAQLCGRAHCHGDSAFCGMIKAVYQTTEALSVAEFGSMHFSPASDKKSLRSVDMCSIFVNDTAKLVHMGLDL